MKLNDAVADLYRIAVKEGLRQSPGRLSALALYCLEQLAGRGCEGAKREVNLEGWVRRKSWDVVWASGGRPRLGISLKSILQNLAGTVPNRTDDLIGEVADVQMRHPEIAIGYILLMDVASDTPPGLGGKWVPTMGERLARMTGRKAPLWGQGVVEASVLVRVNFAEGPELLTKEAEVELFFDQLVTELKTRL